MKPVHRQPAGPEKSHSEITPTVTKSKSRGSQSKVFFFFFFSSLLPQGTGEQCLKTVLVVATGSYA